MEKTKGAESLRKSLRLLDIVKGAPNGTNMASLVEAAGLARPTAYRIVAALMEEGFLEQDAQLKTIRLGPKLLELAQSIWSDGDLRQSARPELEQLASRKGLIASLMVRAGDRMTIIELSAPQLVRSRWHVGATVPIVGSAAGKSVLAFGNWGNIDQEVGVLLPNANAAERLRLKSELGVARSRFYAIGREVDDPAGQYTNSVAAPIFDFSGQVVAAVVLLSEGRSDATLRTMHEMGAAVVQAARKISSARGGYPFGLEVPPLELTGQVSRATLIAKTHCLIGDSPIVDPETGAVFWIDILGPSFLRLDNSSAPVIETGLTEVVGALLRLPDGTFLIAQQTQLAILDKAGQQIWSRAAAGLPAGFRYNDGAIDARGRVWLGTMDMATSQGAGVLQRYQTLDGDPAILPGFSLPNGIGFSLKGENMYVIDSMEKTLNVFDYDLETGNATKRRRVALLGGAEGRPSGLAVSNTGDLFTCHWDGHQILRMNDAGEILDHYAVPVPRPSGVTFDPVRNRLAVTSARVRLSQADVTRYEDSGAVFEIDLNGS
jgi:DNA-binding IclR family transcriptional regulator/sugar lactone lactonase YvrE